ncbi:MAG: hypothetical protein AAFV29_26475, partial [Myxococcota bacterium]
EKLKLALPRREKLNDAIAKSITAVEDTCAHFVNLKPKETPKAPLIQPPGECIDCKGYAKHTRNLAWISTGLLVAGAATATGLGIHVRILESDPSVSAEKGDAFALAANVTWVVTGIFGGAALALWLDYATNDGERAAEPSALETSQSARNTRMYAAPASGREFDDSSSAVSLSSRSAQMSRRSSDIASR